MPYERNFRGGRVRNRTMPGRNNTHYGNQDLGQNQGRIQGRQNQWQQNNSRIMTPQPNTISPWTDPPLLMQNAQQALLPTPPGAPLLANELRNEQRRQNPHQSDLVPYNSLQNIPAILSTQQNPLLQTAVSTGLPNNVSPQVVNMLRNQLINYLTQPPTNAQLNGANVNNNFSQPNGFGMARTVEANLQWNNQRNDFNRRNPNVVPEVIMPNRIQQKAEPNQSNFPQAERQQHPRNGVRQHEPEGSPQFVNNLRNQLMNYLTQPPTNAQLNGANVNNNFSQPNRFGMARTVEANLQWNNQRNDFNRRNPNVVPEVIMPNRIQQKAEPNQSNFPQAERQQHPRSGVRQHEPEGQRSSWKRLVALDESENPSTTHCTGSAEAEQSQQSQQSQVQCDDESKLAASCPNRAKVNPKFPRKRRWIRGKDKVFGGVPADSVKCQICNRKFDGSKGFTEHINGRSHREKIRQTEQEYVKDYKKLIQKAKANNQHTRSDLMRLGRKDLLNRQEYCTVCDLHFVGGVDRHKHLETHKKLEKYYKPKCEECQKEFNSRINYDIHVSSVDHIRTCGLAVYAEDKRKAVQRKIAIASANKNIVAKEQLIGVKSKLSNQTDCHDVTESTYFDEQTGVEVIEIKEEVEEFVEEGSDLTSKPSMDVEVLCSKTPEFDASSIEQEPNLKRKYEVPPYNPNAPFGADAVVPKTGSMCVTCNLFLPNKNSVRMHLVSRNHYDKYIARKTSEMRTGGNLRKIKRFPPQKSNNVGSQRKISNDNSPAKMNESSNSDSQICEITEPSTNTPLTVTNIEDDDEELEQEVDGNWKRQKLCFPEAEAAEASSSIPLSRKASIQTRNDSKSTEKGVKGVNPAPLQEDSPISSAS